MSIKYIFKLTQSYSIMAIDSIEEKEKPEMKVFSEGKSLIEVTIILDRSILEIHGYYNDYLRLIRMDYLISL
jgi:hypothetical protein